jgi:LemA protein
MKIGLIVTIIILLMIAGVCIVKFNNLVKLDEQVDVTWTPLSAQLQQRYDEVPKLVNEVILYTGREDDLTRKMAESYKTFTAAQGMIDKVKAANDVETSVEQLMLQAGQHYPGIESHFQFMELSKGFTTTMQHMAAPMAAYNATVDKYNTYVREFPNNIIAELFGYKHENIYFKKEQD